MAHTELFPPILTLHTEISSSYNGTDREKSPRLCYWRTAQALGMGLQMAGGRGRAPGRAASSPCSRVWFWAVKKPGLMRAHGIHVEGPENCSGHFLSLAFLHWKWSRCGSGRQLTAETAMGPGFRERWKWSWKAWCSQRHGGNYSYVCERDYSPGLPSLG